MNKSIYKLDSPVLQLIKFEMISILYTFIYKILGYSPMIFLYVEEFKE